MAARTACAFGSGSADAHDSGADAALKSSSVRATNRVLALVTIKSGKLRCPRPKRQIKRETTLPNPVESRKEIVRSVFVQQTIRAPAERIWRACSNAVGLRAWQADEIEGEVTQGAELILGWPTLGVSVELEVQLVEAERRIVLCTEDARLELVVAPGRVSLTHSADFDDDERDGTLSSWRLSLATLAHYLEHHDGEERTVHWAIARAATSLEDAHAFFTLSGAQSGWLTRSSTGTGIGEVGTEIALDLAWGSSMTGRVLSHTPPRDVLLSWRETNESVLALRTLPSPDTAGERLLIATWSSWGLTQTEPIAQNLSTALSRLTRILDNRASA
jgi:uncharacterized protein YndB with AHSA1/START domain